ncbi:DNA polymerase III subunit gamma/tau [Methylovirgula sp. HY1]|uniref:DNA polymerase III subunit gamma/tau n=1 Tax=Methylovirgula sp. HY1 TaxID=2822761 RepID=UPI001C5AD60A|nr:DNA polymerase III subunit gamma/tau [Methylovirgula sp. HY1]QXX75402.1 DNA polymerase III subunit tau [Methylovirgula sp. HY1]
MSEEDRAEAVPSLSFPDEETVAAAAAPYRVLARKYRPSSFDDLIGQEAMVKTLSNAFDLGRIHQAYMLTGVRGVGKTTTARILARAFNYELPAQGGQPAVTKPTIHMPELGVHCQAIIESRHVDVIEMDAASHTGIDDVREIIESIRYRPVLARTKVYIIDEVHMLSKQAFNGLLKTLEEPPDHARFVFATTEIEKVPVTVRSRCQRFDLRRVEADVLVAHLAAICAKENVAIEPEALALIARAAEGSVRDALSLLDQAIAYATGAAGTIIMAADMRLMLGLADRGRIIDLFAELMAGDIAAALTGLKELYDAGADPGQILVELAEFIHFVTRLKLLSGNVDDPTVTEDERRRGGEFAQSLSMPVLTRAWQLLLKGMQEVKESPRPLAAADMVLVRLGYAADLPTPDEALRRISGLGAGAAGAGQAPAGRSPSGGSPRAMAGPGGSASARQAAPVPSAAPMPSADASLPTARLSTFEDVVALAAKHRDIQLKMALERDVRIVRFETGSIEFSPRPGASPQLAQTLMRRLQEWTGARWMVAISNEAGGPSLTERNAAAAAAALQGVRALPLVGKVLDHFPGAEIIAVRNGEPAAAADPSSGNSAEDEDVAYIDQAFTEDDL